MHRKFFAVANVLIAFVFVLGMASPVFAASPAAATGSSPEAMPPNPEKILNALIARGEVPANATIDQKEAALKKYLQLKMNAGVSEPNPLAKKKLDSNEASLNSSPAAIRGRKLGNTTAVEPSNPQFKPLQGDDKLLLILVEFSDQGYTWTPNGGQSRTAAGPLHNQIPVPSNDFDLWVPDFSLQHYEDMLFTPGGWNFPADAPRYAGEHRGSMHDFYLEQSYGQYTVDGQAYGWFKVDKPEAYYGDDNPNGGNDNQLPGTTRDLIADAVKVVNAQNAINWADYDTNGDCYIDHPLFIHAGVDQSGGGGAQGDDAIWAHSSSVFQKVSGPTANCPNGLYIYNYTIMPEDGGVGVFAHEFGHDLGLPDEYDTIYSGAGADTAFWSLMSSGSWLGRPAQTQPSDISIWGRYVLGWLKPGDNLAVTNLSDFTKTPIGVRLEQAERWGGDKTYNAVRINLPNKTFTVNKPHGGSYEYYGGKGDEIDTTMRRTVDLTGKTSAALSFWTQYDIESNWDFGFVQVSEDGGSTWKSLPIDGTTSDIDPSGYPAIRDNLPGFTGNSGGWVQKTFDLSEYAGKSIELQFRYMTDWGTSMAGFFVDDINVTADGATLFTDNAESANAGWTLDGWTRFTGSDSKPQYYLLEWRNFAKMETALNGASIVNFDNGLTNVYQHDPYSANPDQPLYYSYNPGLLVWYRDMSQTDNWTAVHPGSGFLLLVDANPRPLQRPPFPGVSQGALLWNNRVQSFDVSFSLTRPPDATLSYFGKEQTVQAGQAVPNFSDSQTYYSNKTPDQGVLTGKYGLIFRVVGQAPDGSAALIGLGTK